jgi:hypothetical protein
MSAYNRSHRRREPDPNAKIKAAVRMMSVIDPQKNYREIPKIVCLVLSIDPRAEVDVLRWLQPVLGSIPWRAVRCQLLSFQRAPIGKWCIAMLHPAAIATGATRIVQVPYASDSDAYAGVVAAAIFPGDCVCLPAHPGLWFDVYEIRTDRNCVLLATAEDDALPNPSKIKSERKKARNYMEINTVHFLGCTVKREVLIGPLNEVVDDWHPVGAVTSEIIKSQDLISYHRIFFQIPRPDLENTLTSLSAISKSLSRSESLSDRFSESADRPSSVQQNNKARSSKGFQEIINSDDAPATFRRKAKIAKQALLFCPAEDEDEGSRGRGVGGGGGGRGSSKSRDDPVESFQRKKHVQVWAARKLELSLAARALAGIDPNPLLHTLGDTFSEDGQRTHLVDSLQLSRKRRDVWLQVGRALRAISRGGADGHVLLSAWRQWTQHGMHARAASERRMQVAEHLHRGGDQGQKQGHGQKQGQEHWQWQAAPMSASVAALEAPGPGCCLAAWYAQRLPSNCDADGLVEARTYIRKRIHELSTCV